MAEYKQYITQIQENGNVMISENVVATIVANALAEVEGVGSLGVKPGIGVADFGTKKNWGKRDYKDVASLTTTHHTTTEQ